MEERYLDTYEVAEPNWFALGRGALIVTVFLFAIGMLNFGIDLSGHWIWGRSAPYWLNYLVDDLTGSMSQIPLLPFLFSFFWRYPLGLRNLWYRIWFYFLALLFFGFMHTTLMSICRVTLYSLLNIGVYSSGEVFYRYLFEYMKQLPSFCYFYLGFHVYKTALYSQQNQLKFAQMQERLGKARMDSLKHQLNPHFLFNTLNVISEEMYESAQNADRLISELSLLLRKNLENVQSDTISLSEELEYVALYMNLMKTRFRDALEYRVDCDSEVIDAKIPVFILQPLVENAAKYAMYSNPKAAVIKVEISRVGGNALCIRVIDNGPGLNSGVKVDGTGVALTNIRGRLTALYDMNMASLNLLQNESGGCTAEVLLPLEI